MAEKKLFVVSTQIDIEMVVLAEDAKQAEEIGRLSWYEEMSNAGLAPEHYDAIEVTRRKQVAWVGEDNLAYCPPYGPEGEPSPQESINEYLDKLGAK